MSGIGMITAMSEVFVAQYNGAKQYLRIGAPVWQMIWFSFFSIGLCVPLCDLGAPLFSINSPYAEMEIVYFCWLMFFCSQLRSYDRIRRAFLSAEAIQS